ncbi:MAG TPA: hypothetical protein VK327_02850 [Candidatus Paceibacterota bacterium]|nr:hypothetical protein [Candidatus Paceibacterota bacterium]
MKKLILMAMTLTMVATGIQTATAGDREWAVVGKVLTGVAAASVISRACEPAPTYAYSQTYYAPAYSYAPAPRVVYAAPAVPVYVAPPAPVYVAPPAPVYYAPAPVVVYRPAYVAPPVIGISFGFGGGHHHRRGCW